MNNHFAGNELHNARRHDLLKEAEGSRRLRAAGVEKPGRSLSLLALKAIGAALVVLLITQMFAR